MTFTYDDILARTLGLAPEAGREHLAGGEWDYVREHVDVRTRRRLVAAGMAGRVRNAWQREAENVRRAERGATDLYTGRGVPSSSDELAAAVGMDAWGACEWFVAACLAVMDGGRVDDREPDAELPGWVVDWLARLVCPVKRDYVRSAAESVYCAGPGPLEQGRAWEAKVWQRLGRRAVAESVREEARLERAAAGAGVAL